MKVLVLALMVVAALCGCSYQATSASFTREAECARYGGRWHPGWAVMRSARKPSLLDEARDGAPEVAPVLCARCRA